MTPDLPDLLHGLPDPMRHQRMRVILDAFLSSATPGPVDDESIARHRQRLVSANARFDPPGSDGGIPDPKGPFFISDELAHLIGQLRPKRPALTDDIAKYSTQAEGEPYPISDTLREKLAREAGVAGEYLGSEPTADERKTE